jgi:hypothetical protein
VDATGLAARPLEPIAAGDDGSQFEGVTPLGSVAHLEFLAQARGRLVGRCALHSSAILGRSRNGEYAAARSS